MFENNDLLFGGESLVGQQVYVANLATYQSVVDRFFVFKMNVMTTSGPSGSKKYINIQ